MKVCLPTKKNEGLESIAFGHFGSAPFFIIYNSDNNEAKVIENQNLHHAHGACNPINALNNEPVDAIIVGGIGARAIQKLNAMNIRVFRAIEGSIANNIEALKLNKLMEFTSQTGCGHHDCGGH